MARHSVNPEDIFLPMKQVIKDDHELNRIIGALSYPYTKADLERMKTKKPRLFAMINWRNKALENQIPDYSHDQDDFDPNKDYQQKFHEVKISTILFADILREDPTFSEVLLLSEHDRKASNSQIVAKYAKTGQWMLISTTDDINFPQGFQKGGYMLKDFNQFLRIRDGIDRKLYLSRCNIYVDRSAMRETIKHFFKGLEEEKVIHISDLYEQSRHTAPKPVGVARSSHQIINDIEKYIDMVPVHFINQFGGAFDEYNEGDTDLEVSARPKRKKRKSRDKIQGPVQEKTLVPIVNPEEIMNRIEVIESGVRGLEDNKLQIAGMERLPVQSRNRITLDIQRRIRQRQAEIDKLLKSLKSLK